MQPMPYFPLYFAFAALTISLRHHALVIEVVEINPEPQPNRLCEWARRLRLRAPARFD
jgi:hypothetical protein